MAKNITVQEAASRLANAGLQFSDRYQKGTQGKGQKWASGAGASEANYNQGVQEAIAAKRFISGIQSAGASSYDTGVMNKGVNNWGSGLQVSADKYARKTQKFAALWNAPLSTPRGARRSPNNLKRMTENVARFQAVK